MSTFEVYDNASGDYEYVGIASVEHLCRAILEMWGLPDEEEEELEESKILLPGPQPPEQVQFLYGSKMPFAKEKTT